MADFKTGGGDMGSAGPIEDLTGLGAEVEAGFSEPNSSESEDALESLRGELAPILDIVVDGIAKSLYEKGYKHIPINELPEDAFKALETAIEIKLMELWEEPSVDGPVN